jgi:hypothetical protein
MRRLCLILLFLVINFIIQGQIVNIENQRVQNDTVRKVFNVESSFSSQRNNELTLTEWHLGCVSQIKSKNSKDMLLFLLNNDKSIADKTVMNNASLAHVRCSHKIHPNIKMEAFYKPSKEDDTDDEMSLAEEGPGVFTGGTRKLQTDWMHFCRR